MSELMVPESVKTLPEASTEEKEESKRLVLQPANGTHMSGKMDIEDIMEEARTVVDKIISENNLDKVMSGPDLEFTRHFRVSNVLHGTRTGVLLEFNSTDMSFSFYTAVLRSGLQTDMLLKVMRASEFYTELEEEELEQDDPRLTLLYLRTVPDLSALDKYSSLIAEHYRLEKQQIDSKILVTELAGEKTNNQDGSILFKFTNVHNINTYPVIPMYLGDKQVGTFSAGRHQISIKGKVLCCDASCAAVDNNHKVGCKGKELMVQKQQKRDYAKAKEFDALLKINQAHAQIMRRGFKAAAKAKCINYCGNFNRKGVPCAGVECKFYPCIEWEELMEGETGETFYQKLPSSHWPKKSRKPGKGAVEKRALRRAAGNGVIDDDEEM